MSVGGRVAALVVAVALLAAGCSTRSSPPVAVIGDSITFLAAPDIQSGLAAQGDHVLLTGRIGYTAAQLAPDVAKFAAQHPRVVLFELGTNDVSQSITGATSAAAYEQVMTGYLHDFGDACLIATTVSSHRGDATMDRTAVAINAWLRAHFAHLVDWDTYEWTQRQTGHPIVETVDYVHPTKVGQQDLARLDAAAIRSCR